jgi:hypothetical protein
MVLCVQDPDPVRYGHRLDPAGAGAEAGLSLHRERHRQRILVPQVGRVLLQVFFLWPDPDFLPDPNPDIDQGVYEINSVADADAGSCAFLTPGSGMKIIRIQDENNPDPGSEIHIKHPG